MQILKEDQIIFLKETFQYEWVVWKIENEREQ